jgi:hypothetical protein
MKGNADMNDGVAMLIERMKTHPEEFAVEGVVSKWDVLISEYRDVLDVLDIKKLDNARRVLLQQRFTQEVMKELIDPIEESNKRKLGGRFTHRLVALGQTPIAGVTQTL